MQFCGRSRATPENARGADPAMEPTPSRTATECLFAWIQCRGEKSEEALNRRAAKAAKPQSSPNRTHPKRCSSTLRSIQVQLLLPPPLPRTLGLPLDATTSIPAHWSNPSFRRRHSLPPRLWRQRGSVYTTGAGSRCGWAEPSRSTTRKLKGVARKLAMAPYKSPARPLPPHVAGLDWDKWQSIVFRKNTRAVGRTRSCPSRRVFHLGFTMTKPVRIYAVENGKSQQLAYDPSAVRLRQVRASSPAMRRRTSGFAGFNLFFHTDFNRDRAAFQGASYFRAVDNSRQYGMSHRGLAVNCGMPEPEEFPDFIAYYLEKPVKGSSQVTLYGLLDSPSVAGAYRFVINVAGHTGDGHRRRAVSAQGDRAHRHRARHEHVLLRQDRSSPRRRLAPGDPRLRWSAAVDRRRRMDLASAEQSAPAAPELICG